MHGEVSHSHQSEHEGIFTGGRDGHEALWGEKTIIRESAAISGFTKIYRITAG